MIKKLILGGIAALALAGPATASEFWAATRNNFDNISLAQFDTATGNMVAGGNVILNYASAGQPPQYVSFDRLGGVAFDSAGAFWAATRNNFDDISLARFDTATGSLVTGSNVILNYASAGQPPQYVGFERLGGVAFDNAGAFWAATRNNFDDISLAQFDTATGNMVAGGNVILNYASAGQPPQYVSFDRLGGVAFDSAGAFWAATRNNFGDISLARFDTATGEMIAGSNVILNYASVGQPPQYTAFDRLGGVAFDSAGNFWAATLNNFGDISLARFDTATGSMVAGSNVLMNYAIAGQPSQYVDFDRLGAIAFGPGGTPVSGVPEPSSWALLIAGFFLTGAATRRRRKLPAGVAAAP